MINKDRLSRNKLQMNKSSPLVPVVRLSQSDDLIQMLRIQTDALRNLCPPYYTSEQIEALVERNIRHASLGGSQREITLVAEVERVIIGLAALLGQRISAVYVHPQFTRQGIGTQLLKVIENVAITRQFQTLSVAASLNAQPFYQANGYRILGESYLVADQNLQIPYIKMKRNLIGGGNQSD
jgi:putative acetyltransferase